MTRTFMLDLLLAPSVTGIRAVAYTIAAVALPTLIRASADSIVSGCELTIYLPFVLFAAVVAGWRYAAATALASAIVAELLLLGRHHDFLLGSCDTYSLSVLFIGSAALIAMVEAFRIVLGGAFQTLAGAASPSGRIIFSSRDGQVWASWYGRGAPVQLGPQKDVAAMMEDFLVQVEVGKRLADRVR